MILDTTFLIDVLNGDPAAEDRRIETEDVLIAATTIHNETAVLTRNTDRFDRIGDVTAESY